MDRPEIKRGIYFIADAGVLDDEQLVPITRAALAGGVTLVQLRAKHATPERMAELGRRLLEVTREFGVPLLINDAVEVAAEIGAEGVHVGQEDMSAARAREMLGPDAIVGVTTECREDVARANADDVDYIAVGALFPSPSKPDADHMTLEEATDLAGLTDLPVCAIGGISEDNIRQLAGVGIDLVCVISAIALADGPEGAARRLRAGMDQWT